MFKCFCLIEYLKIMLKYIFVEEECTKTQIQFEFFGLYRKIHFLDDYNNGSVDNHIVEYQIYQHSFDSNQLTMIVEVNTGDISSVVADGHKIYYKIKGFENSLDKTFEYDISSRKASEIKELENIYDIVAVYDNSLYIIDNEYRSSVSLMKYNLKSKNSKNLFHQRIEGQKIMSL